MSVKFGVLFFVLMYICSIQYCDAGIIKSDHNPTRPCRDGLYYCDDLKRRGDCRTNPYSTLMYCPKSCGICVHECQDRNPTQCSQWAAHHECHKNPEAMFRECPVSCGAC